MTAMVRATGLALPQDAANENGQDTLTGEG